MGMNDHDKPADLEKVNENPPEVQKGRKAAVYRGAECLNCKHPLELSDRYCSYCGQLNTTKQLSLKDFFGEFLSTIFTYDSRLRYTLKDLLFKPGTITRNYVNGQFLKYANPFRFFLSVSLIYFLIQGLISVFNNGNNTFINNNLDNSSSGGAVQVDTTGANLGLDFDEGFAVRDSVINNQVLTYVDSTTGDEIKHAIREADSLRLKKRRILDSIGYEYISESELDTLNDVTGFMKRAELYYRFYQKTDIDDPERALDSLKHYNNGLNKWLYSKNDSIERVKKDPSGFVNYLLGKVPFFLFFFAPMFAWAFWLLYSKKKYTYMEHLVFIFHIFSFLFLALLICLIPDTIIGEDIVSSIVMMLVGPFYFYKALRNFYKQSRLITVLKFVLLNWFFWIGTTVAAVLFFSVTAAIY